MQYLEQISITSNTISIGADGKVKKFYSQKQLDNLTEPCVVSFAEEGLNFGRGGILVDSDLLVTPLSGKKVYHKHKIKITFTESYSKPVADHFSKWLEVVQNG